MHVVMPAHHAMAFIAAAPPSTPGASGLAVAVTAGAVVDGATTSRGTTLRAIVIGAAGPTATGLGWPMAGDYPP